MDVIGLPGKVPGEQVKNPTRHLRREVAPHSGTFFFGHSTTETSRTLQHLLSSAWLRPCIRPRWLKVVPYRSHTSDEFVNWREERGK